MTITLIFTTLTYIYHSKAGVGLSKEPKKYLTVDKVSENTKIKKWHDSITSKIPDYFT